MKTSHHFNRLWCQICYTCGVGLFFRFWSFEISEFWMSGCGHAFVVLLIMALTVLSKCWHSTRWCYLITCETHCPTEVCPMMANWTGIVWRPLWERRMEGSIKGRFWSMALFQEEKPWVLGRRQWLNATPEKLEHLLKASPQPFSPKLSSSSSLSLRTGCGNPEVWGPFSHHSVLAAAILA